MRASALTRPWAELRDQLRGVTAAGDGSAHYNMLTNANVRNDLIKAKVENSKDATKCYAGKIGIADSDGTRQRGERALMDAGPDTGKAERRASCPLRRSQRRSDSQSQRRARAAERRLQTTRPCGHSGSRRAETRGRGALPANEALGEIGRGSGALPKWPTVTRRAERGHRAAEAAPFRMPGRTRTGQRAMRRRARLPCLMLMHHPRRCGASGDSGV